MKISGKVTPERLNEVLQRILPFTMGTNPAAEVVIHGDKVTITIELDRKNSILTTQIESDYTKPIRRSAVISDDEWWEAIEARNARNAKRALRRVKPGENF